MLMPARIMTASWLVKFWMSLALGPKLTTEKLNLRLCVSAAESASERDRMYPARAHGLARDAAARFAAASTPLRDRFRSPALDLRSDSWAWNNKAMSD